MTITNVLEIDGLLSIYANYDVFFIDQWGVLHDGVNIYPNVLQVLKKIKQAGKEIYIISNSARSSEYNAKRMQSLAISNDYYDQIISSGEIFANLISNNLIKQINEPCFYLAYDNDMQDWVQKGIKFDLKLAQCSWILLTSIDSEFSISIWLEKIQANSKLLPLYCLNPDESIVFNGQLFPGPGLLAKEYQKIGGEVIFIGKPYQLIYEKTIKLLKMPQKILCVGDSLQHDIKGANNSQLDSLFIGQGIFSDRLKNQKLITNELNSLFAEYQAYPTYYSLNL